MTMRAVVEGVVIGTSWEYSTFPPASVHDKIRKDPPGSTSSLRKQPPMDAAHGNELRSEHLLIPKLAISYPPSSDVPNDAPVQVEDSVYAMSCMVGGGEYG